MRVQRDAGTAVRRLKSAKVSLRCYESPPPYCLSHPTVSHTTPFANSLCQVPDQFTRTSKGTPKLSLPVAYLSASTLTLCPALQCVDALP